MLNKPVGISSNRALQSVKRLLRAKKAGHAGTLDPQASGMLVIGLGEATKFVQYLLSSSKAYRVRIALGKCTETGDAEGNILSQKPVPYLSKAVIDRVLSRFVGEQEQSPPMFSAVKHQGQRLYVLARQGLKVERKPRKIVIHHLRQQSYCAKLHLLDIEVSCSKGTYIRVLAEDIGKALGCGAYVASLHRYQSFPYIDEACMRTLEQLEEYDRLGTIEQVIYPMDSMMPDFPAFYVNQQQAQALQQGQQVAVSLGTSLGEPGSLVRFYQCQVAAKESSSLFLGLGEVMLGRRIKAKRLLSFK